MSDNNYRPVKEVAREVCEDLGIPFTHDASFTIQTALRSFARAQREVCAAAIRDGAIASAQRDAVLACPAPGDRLQQDILPPGAPNIWDLPGGTDK